MNDTSHNDEPRILVMDGNERNADLLSDFLATDGYKSIVVTDLSQADEAITGTARLTLAIVDIDRFERQIWSYCELLDTHDVPFIVLSGLRNLTLRRESTKRGADSFVEKPITKQELRERIEKAFETTSQ